MSNKKVDGKKVNRLVKEYLRVKELKDEYTRHTNRIREELLKYEKYINRKKLPIRIVTRTTVIYEPSLILKTLKSVPKFVKVVNINKAALKKEVDKKTLALIDSLSQFKESKSIHENFHIPIQGK